MRAPNRDQLRILREVYPPGCRVELLEMDDPYAVPVGTTGTVMLVDAAGTIHVNWDNGRELGVAYGADKCRRVDE